MNTLIENAEEKLQQVLSAAVTEARQIFKHKLKKIILFGSYSRGDYDNESDIDVMILIDDSNPKKYNELLLDIEVDLSIAFDIVLSFFLENASEYEDAKRYKPFIKAIEKEGKEIYAA
jgi:uncharacterized protein